MAQEKDINTFYNLEYLKISKTEKFLRNSFTAEGLYDIPIIKKKDIYLHDVQLIACHETRLNDTPYARAKGIHHFVDDYRFEYLYDKPEKCLKKYFQYSFVLSPEYSLYADMPMWRQIENTVKNRWVEAYWQSMGLKVIASVCWGMPASYDFCFDGIEQNAMVAVGMIGKKRSKKYFMLGYEEMLARLHPSHIIVYGSPFPEMKGNIIPVDYISSKRNVHQPMLFDFKKTDNYNFIAKGRN